MPRLLRRAEDAATGRLSGSSVGDVGRGSGCAGPGAVELRGSGRSGQLEGGEGTAGVPRTGSAAVAVPAGHGETGRTGLWRD